MKKNIIILPHNEEMSETRLMDIVANHGDTISITTKGNGDRKAKIWSVYSDEFDVGEINSYFLTHAEALNMCLAAFNDNEGTIFTILDKDYKES